MGHAGISFNPKDSHELAHCIEKLVLNKDMRAKISKIAKKEGMIFLVGTSMLENLNFCTKIINGHI